MKRILVFAPHPDDEILGCGGTIARNIAEGNEVYVCVVTKGFPPIFKNTAQTKFDMDKDKECHDFLGVKKTFFLDFPAAAIESVDRYILNDSILNVVKEVAPEEVYIPHRGDMQIDHKMVVDACMVALRPKYFPQVKRIYAYETLSETDWDLPNTVNAFIPNVYVNIEGFLEIKLKALDFFPTQMNPFPDPRSKEAVEALARFRGSQMLWNAAEAFMLIRDLR